MKAPRVTLDQWRTLQAVVDHGGFAQAAEVLHRSQSSVSYTVARMQEQLGVPLLRIDGRKAVLTEAGDVLLRRSRQLVKQASQLEDLAHHMEQGWEAEVRLVVDAAYPNARLVRALTAFMPQSRGCRVRLREEVLSGVEEVLHEGIADAYYNALQYLQGREELEWVKVAAAKDLIKGHPALAKIKAKDWLSDDKFQQEVFGAFALMVVYEGEDDLLAIAEKLHGQLTITVWADAEELQNQLFLINLLEEKCGRLLFKCVPTGVEVGYAMQHGGPFPSTTAPNSTSVGAHAIKRFARPIAFQDMPLDLLPVALRVDNLLGIWRLVNGVYSK